MMNERIHDLAMLARKHFPKTETSGEFWVLDEEKFAELIVRECAELCLKNEEFQGLFQTMEFRKGRHFNTIIKHHFGVEL